MTPYINIHTHNSVNENGISIYNNRFLYDTEIKTDHLFSIGIQI